MSEVNDVSVGDGGKVVWVMLAVLSTRRVSLPELQLHFHCQEQEWCHCVVLLLFGVAGAVVIAAVHVGSRRTAGPYAVPWQRAGTLVLLPYICTM